MKTLNMSLSFLGAVVLTSFSLTASAGVYDVTFTAATSDDTIAGGQITVVDGLAIGGSLDLTSGPDAGSYTLVTAGVNGGMGDDGAFTYDNLVTPGSNNGFLDATGGLLLSVSGNAGDSTEVNLWFNPVAQYGAPADSYSLWGYEGGNYNLEAYGASTLLPAAPVNRSVPHNPSVADGGWTGALLGGSMAGLLAFRRKTTV